MPPPPRCPVQRCVVDPLARDAVAAPPDEQGSGGIEMPSKSLQIFPDVLIFFHPQQHSKSTSRLLPNLFKSPKFGLFFQIMSNIAPHVKQEMLRPCSHPPGEDPRGPGDALLVQQSDPLDNLPRGLVSARTAAVLFRPLLLRVNKADRHVWEGGGLG